MTSADDNSEFSIAGLLDRLKETPAQSLIERVDELRARIVKCVFIVTLFFIACFSASREVFQVLKEPLVQALPEGSQALNFTGPLDVFLCYVRVSFLLAAVVSAPILFWQAYRFVAPALPADQRRTAIPYFVWSVALFLAGVAFCHFVMMPVTLEFLIKLGAEVAMPVIMITDYISLVVFMMLGFGLVFQLPIVLLVAEALGIVSLEALSTSRNFVVVGILVIAAVVTPTPDPISQLAMATPMYLMYEIAIILIRAKRRRRAKQAARAAAAA